MRFVVIYIYIYIYKLLNNFNVLREWYEYIDMMFE